MWRWPVLLLLAACGAVSPSVSAPEHGRCQRDSDCAPGLVCVLRTCAMPSEPGDLACAPGDRRCSGETVERCNSAGVFEFEMSCAGGCTNGACLTCTCDANSTDATQRRTCEGDEVMVCRADCTGFDPVEKCASGCDPTTAACR